MNKYKTFLNQIGNKGQIMYIQAGRGSDNDISVFGDGIVTIQQMRAELEKMSGLRRYKYHLDITEDIVMKLKMESKSWLTEYDIINSISWIEGISVIKIYKENFIRMTDYINIVQTYKKVNW